MRSLRRGIGNRPVAVVMRIALFALLALQPPLVSASAALRGEGGGGEAGAALAVVHVLEADRTGISHPAGLAFSPATKGLYVFSSDPVGVGRSRSPLVAALTQLGDVSYTARLNAMVSDPAAVAYDARAHRLLLVAEAGGLLEFGAVGGMLDTQPLVPVDGSALGVGEAHGLAVDPSSGRLFVLDGVGPRIVRVDRPPGGGYAGGAVARFPLQLGGAGHELHGLAFDPSSGHLQVLDASEPALYEISQEGELVARRSLAGLGLHRPAAVVVAPSGDQTDDPSQLNIYVADEGEDRPGAEGAIVELSRAQLAPAASASFTSTLVRTTDTSKWSPPSADPSGLTYLPQSKTLLISDGEIDETVSRITHFNGVNVWEMTFDGGVVGTANISKVAPTVAAITNEPTGIAWNPTSGHYYVSDDDARRVYDVNPGTDSRIGTSDDAWTSFDTATAGSGDPEGVTYDSWHDRIFVADGVNAEIYEFTTTGAPVGHFDVQQYGAVDPESVEFNADAGTLFVLGNDSNPIIVETSTSGALLRTIDYSAAPDVAPAGLAYAPASDGSTSKRFYIVDRGIDNDSNPSIIDGKMFELSAPPPLTPGNLPPTVDAGSDQTVELPAQATLDGTVSDDGLPNPPGAVTTFWTQVSGPGTVTFTDAAAVDTSASFSTSGIYLLRLSASDGEASGAGQVTITVTGAGGSLPLDVRVGASSDDAEESAAGAVSLTSSDLELVYDGSNQAIGIRFNRLPLPQGARILNAYVQFAVDETNTETTALTIAGVAADNPATFSTASRGVSGRPRTSAAVAWSPPAWTTIGEAGTAERTPNLAAVLQEIVDRPGWAAGNSLALVITGTGERTAEAFDGSAATAPLLHADYSTSTTSNAAPTVSIDPVVAVTLPSGATLTGHVADDGRPDPPGATVVSWSMQSGPGVVTFADASSAATTASFSVAGSYLLRLSASDGTLTGYAEVVVVVNPAPPAPSGDPVLAGAGDIAGDPRSGSATAALLAAINPDLVYSSGDSEQNDGTLAQYQANFDPSWGQFKAKIRPAIGNHEFHTPNGQGFRDYFGVPLYYSYEIGAWHIVVLASSSGVSNSAGSAEETWLKADLAAHPNQCIGAVWHQPKFTSGSVNSSDSSWDAVWRDLYAAHAAFVLNGHNHVYERFAPQNPSGVADPNGIREFTVGTGGWGLYSFGTPKPNSEVRYNATYGVIKLTLHPTGYDWQYIPVSGSFSDSGTGTCPGVTAPPTPGNLPPTVDAGSDQTVELPAQATLDGTVSDDGLPDPPAATMVSWTMRSGPGTVSFADAASAATTASFSVAGSYVLRLSASDGALSSYAEVTVTVQPAAPANTAPAVTITAPANPQTFELGAPITFGGTATDTEDGDLTSGLQWKSSVDGAIGTGGSFTTSSLSAGTHTITAAVTDSGGVTGEAQTTVTVTVRDLIFADGFESGDLSAWSSSSTGGGDLSATAAAALVGTHGLQVVINDNQPLFVRDDSPQAEKRYYARFHFDPNSITMGKGKAHTIFSAADAGGATVLQLELRFVGGKYQLRASSTSDAGSASLAVSVSIADAPHAIELLWTAATAAGANDGALTLRLDGAEVGRATGLDNDTRRIDRVSLGAVAGIDTATRGTYYFDEFESRSTSIGS